MSLSIEDGTGTSKRVKVTNSNRLCVSSLETTASTQAAIDGDSFNVASDIVEITDATQAALIHIKNTSQTPWIISRVYFHFGGSTGGVGSGEFCMIGNTTEGTLISNATIQTPVNFNIGSTKTLTGNFYKGTQGSTATNGFEILNSLVPSFLGRNFITLDSVILTGGTSLTLAVIPPAGNTNLKVQVGVNFFIGE